MTASALPLPGREPRDAPWRNPMVWLMLALPAAAVIAGLATVWIAVRAGGSDAIPEDVRRTAQVQTVALGPDAEAAARGLSLVLSVRGDALLLLPAGGDLRADARTPLRLALRHPTRAVEDVELRAQAGTDAWRASHALDRSHDWRVEVRAADGRWRLVGRLPAGAGATLLRPALAPEPTAPDAAAPGAAAARAP
jgi:hypothetical protein